MNEECVEMDAPGKELDGKKKWDFYVTLRLVKDDDML